LTQVTAILSYTDIHSVSTVKSTGVVSRQQARTKPQAQCIPASDIMNERPTTTTTTSSTTTQLLPSMPLSQHDLRLPTAPTSQYDLGLPMPRTSSRTIGLWLCLTFHSQLLMSRIYVSLCLHSTCTLLVLTNSAQTCP